MSRAASISVENNFTQGLKTEFTGLNFPENAATDTDNCIFSRIGKVNRRKGIDFETNFTATILTTSGKAISNFKWTNAGGDGNTEVYVLQVGGTLHFYRMSTATIVDPLSDQKLASTVVLSDFIPDGGFSPDAVECQYASGNGHLFVYHPFLDPFYCTYTAGTIVGNRITVKIRDFQGVEDGLEDNFRPPTLSDLHKYNLQNQGWTDVPAWTATSTTSNTSNIGSKTWTVQSGLSITAGQIASITGRIILLGQVVAIFTMSGTVTSYAGTSLTINVTSTSQSGYVGIVDWTFNSVNTGKLSTWFTAAANYPSNSDVWWYYKNASGVFEPSTTLANIPLGAGPAPKGYYILDAFNQHRSDVSGITGIAEVSTSFRPKTGTWFQGRVWYAGVDATGFTENIYFSQIVERPIQFGRCYQTNDPTSEDRFDLLPSDGGIVRIQGMGAVFKLFPVQNGLIVFASNGVWFITGSQGIGFTATDYTVTQVSSVASIASTSYVDVRGYPLWWNEEGIYFLSPGQESSLQVQNLTDSTIASFYEDIPLSTKKFVRGDYNPITAIVQWIYRSTEEIGINSRYQFNRILNLDMNTGAFYPWTIVSDSTTPHIAGVSYIKDLGGSTTPDPVFKYLTSFTDIGVEKVTFSEERDNNFVDWETQIVGQDYESYFITGYKLHGKGQNKFQPSYVYMYSGNEEDTAYQIQGIWNFATSGNTGRFSTSQLVNINIDDFSNVYRRHKIRGHGVALQLKVASVSGEPFDILGWSMWETLNTHV